ncbi:MAG: anti-anti-sigma factor [Rhodopirellula sp.]|nr:anti-anti-sigma factor [Rhodopirellula sp.]|tara:strand:+ start:717 stop:1067 length:351 start_codon:yes stop_codon:yes gene_type:complete
MKIMEKISLSQNGDVTVVAFSQPKFLDDGDIIQMGDELFQVVDSGVEKILLDMSNVHFLSSAALNRFIMLHKKVKGVGSELRLVAVTPEIEKIFAITRLNTLFSIHPDLSTGLASY